MLPSRRRVSGVEDVDEGTVHGNAHRFHTARADPIDEHQRGAPRPGPWTAKTETVLSPAFTTSR